MKRYITNTELYHHGVKGMKWGVRRYQNPDGTLTEKGKKRKTLSRRKAEYLVNSYNKQLDKTTNLYKSAYKDASMYITARTIVDNKKKRTMLDKITLSNLERKANKAGKKTMKSIDKLLKREDKVVNIKHDKSFYIGYDVVSKMYTVNDKKDN